MAWDGVAYFFGGAFAANFVPHLVAGVSGRPFPTPFAKPPFRGLSSPSVNVLWALANLVAAYTLFEVVGSLDRELHLHVAGKRVRVNLTPPHAEYVARWLTAWMGRPQPPPPGGYWLTE